MGAASSSSADFINAAASLRAEGVPEAGEHDEAAYWARIFPDAPIPALDVFSVIQPEHVRELRQVQPRNLSLLIIKVRRVEMMPALVAGITRRCTCVCA